MFDSRRSTPLLDGYSSTPVNQSVDSYSQRSAVSDGRQSISSSAYSPVTRQPVNSWTASSRTNTTTACGFTTSPLNSVDSISKSANPVLRSTLPSDYKPSGYGSASRGANTRSSSVSSNSIASDGRSRVLRSPAAGSETSKVSRSGVSDQNYGSLTRRHTRSYDSGGRVNGSARRNSRKYERQGTPDQSSEWQVTMSIRLLFFLSVLWGR